MGNMMSFIPRLLCTYILHGLYDREGPMSFPYSSLAVGQISGKKLYIRCGEFCENVCAESQPPQTMKEKSEQATNHPTATIKHCIGAPQSSQHLSCLCPRSNTHPPSHRTVLLRSTFSTFLMARFTISHGVLFFFTSHPISLCSLCLYLLFNFGYFIVMAMIMSIKAEFLFALTIFTSFTEKGQNIKW